MVSLYFLLLGSRKDKADTDNTLASAWFRGSKSLQQEGHVNEGMFYTAAALPLCSDPQLREALLLDVQPLLSQPQAILHFSSIGSSDLSPDRNYVVIAEGIPTAGIWNTITGKQTARLGPANQNIDRAIFSPDGKKILTVGENPVITIWNAATGKRIGSPILVRHRVETAVFSHDGKIILTKCQLYDGQNVYIETWNAETGKLIRLVCTLKDGESTADFSPDGSRIMTIWSTLNPGEDLLHHAAVWDAKTGKAVGHPLAFKGSIKRYIFRQERQKAHRSYCQEQINFWRLFQGPANC
jgi:hypothetical protein